jgi:hypothetical protein
MTIQKMTAHKRKSPATFVAGQTALGGEIGSDCSPPLLFSTYRANSKPRIFPITNNTLQSKPQKSTRTQIAHCSKNNAPN